MGNRLHGLEALRGIAALLVAYNHAAYLAGYPDVLSRLFVRGHVGVDLFFLLSGFVLTRAYEGRMDGASDFLRLRFVRLWPPIAAGVLIAAVAAALWGAEPVWIALGLLSGILLLPLVGYSFILNGPAWSIFFELVANFVHALLLQRLSNGALLVFAGLCSLILLWQISPNGLNLGQGETFWLGFPRLFMSYTMGIVLYRINRDRCWLPHGAAWPVIMAWPLLIIACGLLLPNWGDLALAMFVNPLVLLAALSLGNSRFAALLGAFSFPLYALHYPVMEILGQLGASWLTVLAVAMIASIFGGLVVDPRWRSAVYGLRSSGWFRSLADGRSLCVTNSITRRAASSRCKSDVSKRIASSATTNGASARSRSRRSRPSRSR